MKKSTSDSSKISSMLSTRTIRRLARAGIDTIEQIKANYPERLLRVEGFGIHSLRAVEAAFFPDQKFDPKARKYERQGSASTASTQDNAQPSRT